VHRIFGERGRAWLPRLPEILAQCRERWGLRDGVICPTMSMNYIEFTTTRAGDPVALKVGVPHAELFSEMAALRLYGGDGAAILFDTDRDLGAMLMQRVRPGTTLVEVGDDREQTRVAASLMRDLPVPEPHSHSLPHVADWVTRAFHLTRTAWDPQERMPRDLIDRAEAAFDALLRQSEGDVVLHGDLHHENILLDAERGWIAIDPKGVIGPRTLELGRYVQNQLPEDGTPAQRERVVRARVRILSEELGYAPEVVAAAALVDCILGHCWCFEDTALGPYWYQGIELGRLLCAIAGYEVRE
jgi:streptomycin 6-kinase